MKNAEEYLISKEDFKKYFKEKMTISKKEYVDYFKQKSCQKSCQIKNKTDTT